MHFNLHKLNFAISLLALLSCRQISAQDVDRKRVDINYIQLPLFSLPPEVETYYVNIKPKNTGWGNALGNVYDAERIRFNGYYRLPDAADADLIVESEVVNDLIYENVYEKNVTLTHKKDKNSPEIQYTAYYYYVSYYAPRLRYRISTKSGKSLTEGYMGGVLSGFNYGGTSYSDHFSNPYSLSSAWSNSKNNLLAGRERDGYNSVITALKSTCMLYCMYPVKVDFAVRYVDEKKGRTIYADLLEARNYYLQAVSYISNDSVTLINKLVQPDYLSRKDTMKKAIDIWEKALAEADYDNKKARIDSKVARHLYYNLALAYLWIDDFVKAKEYAQGRKKDVGGWDKNLLAGIESLSALIDDRAARQEANKWRKLLIADSSMYVYKDPATRKREREEAAKVMLANLNAQKADSIAMLKKSKGNVAKGKAGKSSKGNSAHGKVIAVTPKKAVGLKSTVKN